MRKLYPHFFFLFFIVSYCKAQNPTPNHGFENWVDTTVSGETFYNPENWYTLNPLTAVVGKLTCQRSTNADSGTYAVELITEVVFTDTANGIMSTGKFNIQTQNVYGGIPYNQRPDSMYGWYEYFPAKGDSTDIQFGVYDNSGNTIGIASFVTGDTQKVYKRFSVQIQYYSAATPDTSRWLLSSSNGHKSFPGSTLFIDNIGVTFQGQAGINTLTASHPLISILPNPASDHITILNPKQIQGTMVLFSETGALVRQLQLSSAQQMLDVHDLASGNYFYTVKDATGLNVANGTIVLK